MHEHQSTNDLAWTTFLEELSVARSGSGEKHPYSGLSAHSELR